MPLLPFALSLLLGLLAGQWVSTSWLTLVVTLVIALLVHRWPRVQSVMLFVCFVVLGMVLMTRAQRALHQLPARTIVSGEAVIASEGEEKSRTIAYDILLAADGTKLKCYVAKDVRTTRLQPGDGIVIKGRIMADEGNSAKERKQGEGRSGSYDRYLLLHGYAGRCYVGSSQWKERQVSLQGLSMVQRSRLWFLRQRHQLLQRYRQLQLDEEQYAVLAAMTLGDKSALAQTGARATRDTYSITGASHVLALSGLHLGIIYMLLSLLTLGRRLRFLVQTLTVLSLWAFAFLVGLSPSVVRSATMLTVFALLSLSYRQRMSVNALLFTGMAMLMVSPLTLFDVGFQLSFTAVLSILLWMPLLQQLPQWCLPHRQPSVALSAPFLLRHPLLRWAWGMVAVSLAAQLGTAPLITYYFGRFPTYFLLTNFIVVPAATCILYGALLILLWPWPPLVKVLSWVLEVLNGTLSHIAQWPLASIEGLHPSIPQVVLLYIIIIVSYALAQRLSPKAPSIKS